MKNKIFLDSTILCRLVVCELPMSRSRVPSK